MAHLLPQTLFSVTGKVVLITGAGSGIGRMLAKGYTVNSATTILVDINAISLAETKSMCLVATESVGVAAEIHTYTADLSTPSSISDLVTLLLSHHTSLDVLIHCASTRALNSITYTPGDSLSQLETATKSASWESWDKTFQINVLAPYFLTAGLITLLGKAAEKGDGSGCVVLFSSPASVHNAQFVPAYQTSKAAVDHLVRVLAAEFAGFYIRVNAISPGLVPSGMSDVNDPTSNIHLAHETPARRAGTEDDMVGVAIWLTSRAGAFMDGKVIRIDGGRLLILKGVISNHD